MNELFDSVSVWRIIRKRSRGSKSAQRIRGDLGAYQVLYSVRIGLRSSRCAGVASCWMRARSTMSTVFRHGTKTSAEGRKWVPRHERAAAAARVLPEGRASARRPRIITRRNNPLSLPRSERRPIPNRSPRVHRLRTAKRARSRAPRAGPRLARCLWTPVGR